MLIVNLLTQFYWGDSIFVLISFAALILILSLAVYIGIKLYRKFIR